MALNGMIENAKSRDSGELGDVELASPVMQVSPVNLMNYTIDTSDSVSSQSICFHHLQKTVCPDANLDTIRISKCS